MPMQYGGGVPVPKPKSPEPVRPPNIAGLATAHGAPPSTYWGAPLPVPAGARGSLVQGQAMSPWPVVNLVSRYAPRFQIDPVAALANAMGEGGWGWGAVGDHGTSFGPFQLHEGGALPEGKDAAWANSKKGVLYALRKMAEAGAAGLKGEAALTSMVRDFERPADIPGAIETRLGYMDEARKALGKRAKVRVLPGLEELLYQHRLWDSGGGFYNDANTTENHQTHLHQAFSNPYLGLKSLRVGQNKFDLRPAENPYVDQVDPVHSDKSWHYRVFEGRYGPQDKQLGSAIDWTGSHENLNAFYNWLSKRTGVTGPAVKGGGGQYNMTGVGTPTDQWTSLRDNAPQAEAGAAPAIAALAGMAGGQSRRKRGKGGTSNEVIEQIIDALRFQAMGARMGGM